MRNFICILMVVAAAFISGCGSKVNEPLNSSNRFTVVERLGENALPDEYIVVDNESGYEYFATHNRDGYIIGGNVLDKDGHPKKYVK